MELKNKYIGAWTGMDGTLKFLKKEGGKKNTDEIKNFTPYFWVKFSEWAQFKEQCPPKIRNNFIQAEDVGEWVKVYYCYSGRDALLEFFIDKDDLHTFELDLKPHELYMVNNHVQIEEKYSILYFDIETKDTVGDVEIGRDRIISIAAVDNNGNEFVFSEDDEKQMLTKAIELIKKYDVIIGYNSQKFDLPYLKVRLQKHHIAMNWNYVQHLDMLKMLKSNQFLRRRMSELGVISWSLESMARTFLKEAKYELTDSDEGYGGRLWNLFNTNREKLKQYNLHDCVLLKKLDDTFNLMITQIEICKLSRTFLQKSVNVSNVVDNLILQEGARRNVHFKTVFWGKEKKEKFQGGFVFESIPGLHKNVCVFDFSGMYPSIVRTFNISLECLSNENDGIAIPIFNAKTGEFVKNVVFTRKFRGILPSLLDEMQNLRYKYKAEKEEMFHKHGKNSPEFNLAAVKELAVKVVALTMYGINGAAFSRYFNPDVAGSVTGMGRYLIQNVSKYLKTLNYETKLGDTDSLFISVPDLDDVLKTKKIQNLIKDYLDNLISTEFKLEKHWLKMDLEKIAESAIILTKKRYTMHVVFEADKEINSLYSRGVELCRGDFTQLGKRFFEEIARQILIEKKSIDELIKTVQNYKKQLLKGAIIAEDILITQEISKMYEDYTSIPVHVQLAKERLDIGKDRYYINQKVPYIIVASRPSLKAIHYKDFNGEFDKEYYWTNKIYPAVQRVLEIAFPKYDWESLKSPEMSTQKQLNSVYFPKTVLNSFEGVVCDECTNKMRRPTLNCKCDKCGSNKISFFNGTEIAKEVVVT